MLSVTPDRFYKILGSTWREEQTQYFLTIMSANWSLPNLRCFGFTPDCSEGDGGTVDASRSDDLPRCYFQEYELEHALGILAIAVYLSVYCHIAVHKLFVYAALAACAQTLCVCRTRRMRINSLCMPHSPHAPHGCGMHSRGAATCYSHTTRAARQATALATRLPMLDSRGAS